MLQKSAKSGAYLLPKDARKLSHKLALIFDISTQQLVGPGWSEQGPVK